MSAKAKLKAFFLENIGVVLDKDQLHKAAGISEWARRVRELRDEEGWEILTHHDRGDLKPGEYVLASIPPERPDVQFQRGISAKLRAEVLDRNGFTCQMCGLSPGEVDPATGRKVRLHIGHILDKSQGGLDELGNLRTLCSTCNQGAKNVTHQPPTWIWLSQQIRRATEADQRKAYDWLKRKFGDG